VFVNGVSLDSTDYTATNGTSVVLASGAALNDEVVIVAFKSFTVADTYTKGEVDAFAVKLTGAQTVAGVKTFSSQPVFSAGIDLSSNGQVKFPATQSASADANTLDDYEEGTFTPTIYTDGTQPTLTYSKQFGKYTKIGNLVTVQFDVRLATLSGGTGNVLIGGLPFANSANYAVGVVTEKGGVTITAGTWMSAEVIQSASSIVIYQNPTNSATTTVAISALSSSAYFIGGAFYNI
jgi:hypothetical protein